MSNIDVVQQFRDHLAAGKKDANTEGLIRLAQDLLPRIGSAKEGDELVELIRGMANLLPERPKAWLGSSAVRM